MNNILAMTGDKMDAIAEKRVCDSDWSMDCYFKQRFGFKFLAYVSGLPCYGRWEGGHHIYEITDPSLYTAYLLIHGENES